MAVSDGDDSLSITSSEEERNDTLQADRRAYWRANLRVMGTLLTVWFVVSFGLGIFFVEPLNRFHMGGFPVGFWFAHQGSIYVFVVLIFIYARWMDRIDARFGAGRK